jgi:hypothetical protein
MYVCTVHKIGEQQNSPAGAMWRQQCSVRGLKGLRSQVVMLRLFVVSTKRLTAGCIKPPVESRSLSD